MAEAKIKLSVDGATASVAALNSVQGGLNNLTGTVKSLGGGLAGLGLSLSVGSVVAYFAAINKGVDALSDLKDATGASIENISALEDVAARTGAGFDVVSTSLIKLNQALNTAKAGSDAELAINAIGLSVKELKALDPAEAFRQTAVALAQFEDDANKARLTQILFGKSLKEVAPFLKDLAEAGDLVATVTTEQAEATEKFNKELSSLNKSVTDIARSLAGPLVDALNTVIARFREGRATGKGFFEIAYARYWENVRGFYGMGEPNTGGAEGSWGAPDPGNRPTVGDLPDSAAIKAAADAAAKAAAAANKELSEQAKLMAELSGLSGSFAEDWARLNAIFGAGKLSVKGLTVAQAELLAKQPFMKEAAAATAEGLKAEQKLRDELTKTMDEYAKATMASVATSVEAAQKAEEELAQYGLLKSQVQQLTLAHLEQSRELAALAGEDVANIEKRIEAQKRLIAATQGIEAKDIAKQSAKDAADEWQKSADQINQSLSDALMDAFNAGKGFGKTFVDSVTSMFKTMVLRPVISAIVTGATGSLGLSGTANAATSGGALGGLGNVASLFGAGGISGSLMAGAGWLTGATTLGGSLTAGLSLLGTQTVAGSLAGAGMIAGALGPIAVGIGAIYSLAKSLDHSGTPHTGGGSQYSAAGGLLSAQTSTFASGFTGIDYSASTTEFTAGITQAIVGILDSTASAFGKTAGYTAAASFADDSSTDGAWGSLRIADAVGTALSDWQAGGVSFRTFSDGSAGSAEYLAAISQDVRTALNGIGVPQWAQDMLNKLGDAPTLEQLAATVGQITAIENAIVAQRTGLQQQLDLLTGVTTARELERAALDETNRALYDQIKAVEDQQTATDALAKASEDAARAMESAVGSVNDEIKRLRGELTGSSRGGEAYLTALFATTTGQARAGSIAAMESLPEISQALEAAAALNATSSVDLARTRAWLAGSLSTTSGGLHGDVFGAMPGTGGSYASAQAAGTAQLEALVQKLTTEVEGLRVEARAIATHTSNTSRQIERLTPDGDALAVREAAAL